MSKKAAKPGPLKKPSKVRDLAKRKDELTEKELEGVSAGGSGFDCGYRTSSCSRLTVVVQSAQQKKSLSVTIE